MKNKVNLKKYLLLFLILFLAFAFLFFIMNWLQYQRYTKNVNIVINQIVSEVKNKYPNVDINEIIKILNNENEDTNNLLEEYGISIQKDSAIIKNSADYNFFVYIYIAMLLLLFTIFLIIFIIYQKNQNKKIKEITRYIEEINNKNYKLDINENSEDELSILKNELYKITIMLKEQAENSKKDKINLKKSLEDISHQLKTPLTSINIMLDNILDNPNMDVNTRNEFIKDIHREISNINFFVQSLLKLSKFDADTIVFNDKEEKLINIINEAVKNVSVLCDLKNIKILISHSMESKKQQSSIEKNKYENSNVIGHENRNPVAFCDLKWQVEAVTNILKNSVEHSKENSKIYITYDENNMYSEIAIKDDGIGIAKEDLKHIFERFYKGKNSSKDSVGIGLALAKTIIEKENGYIVVESEIGKGTIFYIRYIK